MTNKIHLKNIDTKAPKKFNKTKCKHELESLRKELFSLQNLFYAAHSYSFLIIFQGIDTSGKDGTISHVFSCINPLGVQATSFKAPCSMELEHDYMWRIYHRLPEKGMIEIFNRSYYEDILVPTIQKTLNSDVIEKRYNFIRSFERHLTNNKTIILKFFLHISADEQKKRIQERQKNPLKKWKYSDGDTESSEKWDSYTKAYENILTQCRKEIPWIIIPADNKWYRNYLVASTIVKEIKKLKLKYPNKAN